MPHTFTHTYPYLPKTTDHRAWAHLPALQKWTDAYHDGGFLTYSGVIRGALVLDLPPVPSSLPTTHPVTVVAAPGPLRLLTIGAFVRGCVRACGLRCWVGYFIWSIVGLVGLPHNPVPTPSTYINS